MSFSVAVCFPMLMIWFNKPHDLTKFTPAWAFLVCTTTVYPLSLADGVLVPGFPHGSYWEF